MELSTAYCDKSLPQYDQIKIDDFVSVIKYTGKDSYMKKLAVPKYKYQVTDIEDCSQDNDRVSICNDCTTDNLAIHGWNADTGHVCLCNAVLADADGRKYKVRR